MNINERFSITPNHKRVVSNNTCKSVNFWLSICFIQRKTGNRTIKLKQYVHPTQRLARIPSTELSHPNLLLHVSSNIDSVQRTKGETNLKTNKEIEYNILH